MLLAAIASRLAYTYDGRDMQKASLAFIVVFMSPVIALNSAAWAQCDSMWASMCLLTLLMLREDKPLLAFAAYGMAMCCKLQAVFFLPYLLYVWVAEHKYSLACFLEVPAAMLLCSLPTIAAGRSVLESVSVYVEQTDTYRYMGMNSQSFWGLLFKPTKSPSRFGSEWYAEFKWAAIFLTMGVVLILIYVFLIRGMGESQSRRERDDSSGFDKTATGHDVTIAALMTYAVVLFLPAMHERYAYLSEVLLLIAAVCNWRYLFSAFLIHAATLWTYAVFLFDAPVPNYAMLGALGLANLLIMIILTLRLGVSQTASEPSVGQTSTKLTSEF